MQGNSSKTFWNVDYQSLEEVTSNGGNVPGQRSWTLNNVALTTGSGSDYSWVVGTASTSGAFGSPSIVFKNAMYVTQSTAVINNGTANITVPVTANNMKISVNITGWTFNSASNKLQLRVKISSNQNGNAANIAPTTNGDGSQSIKLGADGMYSAAITFETWCYTGMPGALVEQVVLVSSSGNINYLQFPASNYIFYDPTIGYTSNGVGAIGVSLLAVLVAALAAFYSY